MRGFTIVAAAAMLALTGTMAMAGNIQTNPSTDAGTMVIVQAAKKGRPQSQWVRAESQHFVVYSDAGKPDIQVLLSRMEKFRYMLRSYLRQDTGNDSDTTKTELFYLSHEQDLGIAQPDGPEYAIGLYKGCEDGAEGYGVHMYYNAQSTLPLEKQPDNEGLGYIFQAYARHYFYANSNDRQPLWFRDGFANYMSTARFDGNEAIIGMAPTAMARYLNLIGNMMPYSLNYKDVLQDQDSNGHSTVGLAGVHNEFQVRSWLLVHYILSSQANRQKFHTYIDAVNAGQPPLKAFQTSFGMTAGQLDNTLWQYRRTHLEALKLKFKALPEADVTFDTQPGSAEHLLMWHAALRTCPSSTYGPELLKKVRAEAPKYPQSPLAQLAASRAEILWGDPKAALPYLTQATTNTSSDTEAFHLLGRTWLALATHQGGEARQISLKAALTAFGHASVLDPKAADTAWYFYRTQVLLNGTPDEDGEGAALLAWQQAPQIDTYALHAGLVYAHLGRKAEALQALHSVADNPRGRSLSATAKMWIGRIESGVDDAALLDAMRADYPMPKGGAEEWTLATADVVQAAKDAADTADAQAALSLADPQDAQASSGGVFGH